MIQTRPKSRRPLFGLPASFACAALLATALGGLASPAAAQVPDRQALNMSPTLVDADKAFKLEILSYRWNCAATYSHISAVRTGNRIDIRFAVHQQMDVACPAIDMPYGPEIGVPAISAGRYDVHVTALAPCQVGVPACLIPEREERVGILTVGKRENADWFIRPVTVAAGKDFELQILSDKYGNCQTTFPHSSIAVNGYLTYFTFSTVTNPAIDCIMDIHPHGPSFTVKGLPAGTYTVSVIEPPDCAYDPQPCPMIPPVPRIVDNLVVTGTSGVEPARRSPPVKARGRILFTGGLFQVTLPDGGSRRTGPADLQGRTLRLPETGEAAP